VFDIICPKGAKPVDKLWINHKRVILKKSEVISFPVFNGILAKSLSDKDLA
jgi:hypothetical protein